MANKEPLDPIDKTDPDDPIESSEPADKAEPNENADTTEAPDRTEPHERHESSDDEPDDIQERTTTRTYPLPTGSGVGPWDGQRYPPPDDSFATSHRTLGQVVDCIGDPPDVGPLERLDAWIERRDLMVEDRADPDPVPCRCGPWT